MSNPVFHDEQPPPYSPTAATSSLSSRPVEAIASLFTSHLTELPSRITSVRAARDSAHEQRDSEILATMVPYIEDLLASITSMDPLPTLAELIMVPKSAVQNDWQFSDESTRRDGEVTTIVRIEGSSKTKGDKKVLVQPETDSVQMDRGFKDWGRWEDGEISKISRDLDLWWSDEEMARRLAKYLQPAPRVDRRAVKTHVEQTKETKKTSLWGLFKKDEPAPAPAPPITSNKLEDEGATMTVKADEVTFRTENDLGIWESRTGWAVVVRVRVK